MKLTVFILLCFALLCVNGQITYHQPEKVIRCPPANEVCEVNLTVSTMLTLTAYAVSDDGARGQFGFAVGVNGDGDFEFLYGRGPRTTPRTLLQPIVGDGATRRYLYVVNDQFPAPAIIGYRNQRVRIRVYNRLVDEAVSMHWHGQHQVGTPHMDGAAHVSECPILPGNSFVYEFNLYPQGTFWYHAHLGNQVSNGLYGALLILPPEPEPTDYTDMLNEHTILLNEWFRVNSKEWQQNPAAFVDPADSNMAFNPVPLHDGSEAVFSPFLGGLINEVGWMYTQDSTTCTRLANTRLPFFNVTQGTRYRFRLIGSQANAALRFSIQNHRLQLLASDGFNIQPKPNFPNEVDYIILHVGERYDFIVEANQPVNNFVIIAETLEDPNVLSSRGYCMKAHRAYAVLHYDGAPDILPSDFDDYNAYARCAESQCYAVNCPFENYQSSLNTTCINLQNLISPTPQPVPSNDISDPVFLHFGFDNGGLSVNGRLFSFPPSPFVSQLEDIDESSFCPYTQDPEVYGVTRCHHTYTATTETIEIILIAQGVPGAPIFGSPHPAHIHGHHFHVLHTGYPRYNADGIIEALHPDLTCGRSCSFNVSWANGGPPPSECEAENNCPLKDTVMVPSGGYVRVRFPRNNWGWWLLHCHIGSHFSLGMGMVVNATSASNPVPTPENFPRCGMHQSYTVSGVSEQELGMNQNAVIALAVVAGILLMLLVAMLTVCLCLCVVCCKRGNKGEKGDPDIMMDQKKPYN